jgi:hypothetical protein
MDEFSFVRRLIEASPQLATLVAIVWLFVTYLRSRDEADQQRESVNRNFMQNLGDSCHQNHRDIAERTAKSIDANTDATDKLRETIERKLL